jgi:hypothetical protein
MSWERNRVSREIQRVNRSRETKEELMPNLTRYTLTYDERRNRWALEEDGPTGW